MSRAILVGAIAVVVGAFAFLAMRPGGEPLGGAVPRIDSESPSDRAPGFSAAPREPVAPIERESAAESPVAEVDDWPERVGNNDELAQIASITGLTRREVYEQIQRVSPEWFSWELEPLAPWEGVRLHVADHFVSTLVGRTEEERDALFEAELLGQSLDEFLVEKDVALDWSPDDRAAFELALRDARTSFDLRWSEARVAIEHKVGLGGFDYWPYVTMGQLRSHTNQRRPLTMAAAGGIEGSWIVQLDLYEGEYPQLDLAHSDWRALIAEFRARLAEWGSSGQ